MPVYEVRIVNGSPYAGTRFKYESDEPLAVDDAVHHEGASFRVTRVLPETEDYDGIVEAKWALGPPEATFGP